MNIEAKKKYEFLESVSAIMDAHLRYFKLVRLCILAVTFLDLNVFVLPKINRVDFFLLSLGLRVIEATGTIYSPGMIVDFFFDQTKKKLFP